MKKKKNSSKKDKSIETKKDFYRRILYIILCIIPIYLFAKEEGAFRLVPLPFILIAMYQLLLLVQSSQFIIDAFFPPKITVEKTTKSFDKFMYYFCSGLFGFSLLFLTFEIRKIDNTINGTQLFWVSGFVGIVIAIFITILLKITNPSLYYVSNRRYTVYFGLFIGLFLLASASGSFINHFFASETKICTSYTILRKGSSGSRNKEYFIFLLLENNKEERFTIRKSLHDELIEKGKIEVCMIKGKLGFYYVTDFNRMS